MCLLQLLKSWVCKKTIVLYRVESRSYGNTDQQAAYAQSDEVIGYKVSDQAVEMRIKEARTLRKAMQVASSQD